MLRRGPNRRNPRNKGPKRIEEPLSQGLMKLLADGGEPVEPVPAVLDPVQKQVAPRTVPAEARNAAAAIPVPPDRTKSEDRKLALDFRILRAKSQQFLYGRRPHTHPVELADRLV